MEQVSTRDLLQELAQQPIGSRELQAQPPRDENGNVKPEVKEAAHRASKVWLPQGRKASRTTPAERREFAERQTDIEDAVEAAGGRRGGRNAA